MKLGKHLFWDSDPDKVDLEKNARQVIERVMTRGRLEDFFAARDYYGWDRIKAEVVRDTVEQYLKR